MMRMSFFRKRWKILTVLAVVAATAAIAAGIGVWRWHRHGPEQPEIDPKDLIRLDQDDLCVRVEQKRLSGVWFEPTWGMVFAIAGDHLVKYSWDSPPGRPDDCTFKLDPTKTPKRLDLFRGGCPSMAVYELQADGDILKIRFGPYIRPTSMTTGLASMTLLFVRKERASLLPGAQEKMRYWKEEAEGMYPELKKLEEGTKDDSDPDDGKPKQ